MIDDIVKRVTERTGLSQEHAKASVDTVLSFLKERLPAPLASSLDSAISGQAAGGGALSGLGSLFGNK